MLTPQATLRAWIIATLGELGGSAPRGDVLTAMETGYGDHFTEEDMEPVESRPFEVKWRNRSSWERDHMVKEGLLKQGVRVWALTEQAWATVAPAAPRTLEDALAHFKPKSSGEYRARIVGGTIVKARAHEQLVADFGHHVAAAGHFPRTDVHPRDLTVHADGAEWLVEAKILYEGNATEAVRAAVAQLLMYAYLLYDEDPPKLLALFSEAVGIEYVAFLQSVGVESIWRHDGGWRASLGALGLIR